MNPNDLLYGVLVPAALSGATLLIAWGLASGAARRDASAPALAPALAISLAGLAGFGLLFGWNPWPAESWLWMSWVFPAAAVCAVFEARAESPSALRWSARVILVVAAVGVVLRKPLGLAGGAVDFTKLALYIGAPLVVIALWQRLLVRLGAAAGAGVLWLLSTATSAMLLFGHSLKLAQIAGAISAGLGALIVACWLRPSASGMAGAITPVAVFLSTLVFLNLEFSYSSYSSGLFVLIALAPLFGATPFVRGTPMRFALIAIPLAAAVGLAFSTYDTSAL